MKSKKVKRIAIGTAIVAVLVAVVLGVLAALGINLFSCAKNSGPSDAPETTVNVSAAPPTDGSLPTAHTGIENISYMVYVLDNQTSWHSYSDTDSIAAGGINNQKTYTYKDYKDGVLIASDMTYSSFVQSSTQTAYVGDGAYTRTGSKPGKSTAITEIVWNEGEPEYLERQSYYEKYGLFADEISVFLLNEDTISSYGEVVDNGDGTYTQKFTLDPVASSYYYQYNMYTRGGLSAYPSFTTVNLTFTFDAQWQVLEVQTYEVADVSMGVISTTNTSESHITYTYGSDCVDEYNYAFYESYFKQYVGNVAEGNTSATDGELGVTEVLQYGFGEVLSGGKQYAMDIVVGDTVYTGYIYASVDLNTLSVDTLSAMDIRLSLGKTADDQQLYIELSDGEIAVYYSDQFAVSGNLSELSLMIDQLSALFGGTDDSGAQTVALNADSLNTITLLAKSLLADESDEDTDVLTQLLSIIQVTETDDGATLTIQTDDLLGTGIGIDMTMEFVKDDTSVLTFTNATVKSISYGGEELSVSVALSETEAEVITRNEDMTPVSLSDFVANVYDLLDSDLLELTITMDGASSDYAALEGLSVGASALLDINSVVVGADLYVSYTTEGGSLSAKIKAYYNYGASEYGDIYLYLYELDGKSVDVKLYCDVSELADAVTVLLGGETDDADEVAEEVSQSVAQIINSVLALDFSSVITKLYASGSDICLGVDLDTIMTLLGADSLPRLGTAALVYDGESLALTLEALGLSIDLGKATGAIEEPDLSEYTDLTALINEIYSLINSNTFNITLALDGDSENYTVSQLSGLSVDLSASFDTTSLVLSSAAEISYTSGANVISAKLKIYYVYSEENYGTIYVNLYDICGKAVEVKLRADISDIEALADGLLSGITESADLTLDDSVGLSEILEAVVAFDFNSAITVLSADKEQIKLGLDVDNILSQLGVDVSGMGAVELTYADGAFTAAAQNLGLSASLTGSDTEVSAPDDAESYLDVIAAAQDIYSVINSEIIDIEVSIDGGALLGSLTEGGYLDGLTLDGDIKLSTSDWAVYADLDLNYTYNYQSVSLGLLCYYDGAAVYLLIDEINGAAASIGLSCEIETLSEALTSILALADSGDGEEGDGGQAAADIVTVLLAMDYSSIIDELTANAETLALTVNVDSVLSQLAASGIISDSLTSYSFGSVALEYSEGALKLSANNLGIGATLNGESGAIAKPAANYLSVESVLGLVASVQDEIAEIESAQSVYFDIDCYVTAEELTLGIEGCGEVDWSGESATVALDLTLSIQDGSSNPDKISVMLLYAADGTITITVGKLGIQVTSDDISGLQSGFEDLLEAILTLAGTSGNSLENSQTVSAVAEVDASEELNNLLLNSDLPDILTALLEIVSSTEWVEQLSQFTLSVDSVSAALEYADGYTLTFTADGGLALISISASGNENYIKVSSGIGLYATVESTINSGDYTIMTTDENTKLTEIIYNFGLGVISNASIANTLGTDTYTISLTLDGDNTGVEALEGVTVSASLYYTDSLTEGDKLTEMDIDMDINGATVVFNIIYYEESLYITLTNINGTNLNDLKLTVALGDVYDIADQLVEVLLNTNLIDFFASGTATVSDGEAEEIAEETADTISGILVKLLSLDFSKLVGTVSTADTENGTETRSVWVNIDEIYKQFTDGETLGLGTVTASIITTADEGGNIVSRAIEATGVYNDAVWLYIGAESTEARDYSSFDATEYWDLAFLKYLISDAVDFATDDNGEIYTIYTFSGDLTASVIGIDINIDVLNLTVGLDENNHIYVTLLGDLDSSVATEDWLFGFNMAYSSEYGGYLVTCANNLGTTDAQYQVMTLNYLTDNLLKSNSCLKFMLGTSSTLWNLICSGLSAGGIALDSGIATPDELYLTNSGTDLETTESSQSSEFDITTIITGITALIDGESYACGTTNVSYGKLSSQIGSSDYYAIDVNNDTIDSLTGGGITEVYAAILRDSDGISGLVANGSIGGVMSFTLNLTYNEGIDKEYDLLSGEGTLVYEQAQAAESEFYTVATETGADGYYVIDGNGNYVYTNSYGESDTLYVFANETYYINNGDGTYTLATSYDSTATYYVANYSSDITGFYAPNLYNVVITNYGQELDYDRYSETEGSTNTFGCFTMTYNGTEWTGEYTDQTELYYFTLTVIYPEDSGIATQSYQLKYSSTIYAQASDNTFANGDLYVYYIVTYDEEGEEVLTPLGTTYTFTGDITVKAKLVEYQVTVNGIVYTFDADSNGYAVTGVSGEGYSGSVLVLESEINGYEVKSISAGAFGSVFVSGGAYGSVTTIVLPESITTIGGRAFYACTNLQNVVCLADTIILETDGTTSGLGSDHGYPFYDCSSSLTLYYTNLDSSVDSSKCFEYYESWWTYSPVNTVTSGWTYTGGAVSDCELEALESVISGVLLNYSGVNVTDDINDITTAVQNAIDAYMLENYGYVGYYRVELSVSEELDGRYNVITATVNSGYGKFYKLEIGAGYGTVEISSEDDNIYYYNGEAYVEEGTTVILTVSDIQTGYSFNGYEATYGSVVYENGEYSYAMPSQEVSITATYKVAEVKVTVYSELSFTYDYNGTDLSYVVNTDSTITAVEDAALTTSVTAAESGYYFLGWAQVVNNELVFIGSEVTAAEGLELYAIWGYSSQSLTGYTFATSGASLVTDLACDSGTFYKWYSDGAFTTEITEISTANTVVYARWQFTFSANYSGSSTTLYLNGSNSGSYSSYTYSENVLEGYTVGITYTVYSKTSLFTTTAYTTCIIATYDESGNQVSSVSIYFSASGKSRYLYTTGYVGNWSVTTVGDSNNRISTSDLCSSYATSATVDQNISISYAF